MTDAERAVAGGMVGDPRNIAYAWASLRPDDFEDPVHRWLFELLVEAWHRSSGTFAPGSRYRSLVGAMYAQEFDVPAAVAACWLEELEGWDLGETAFRCYVDELAARGAVRRVQHLLAGWYAAVTPLVVDGAPVMRWLNYVGAPQVRAYETAMRYMRRLEEDESAMLGGAPPPQDVRSILAGLLREVRAAVRRAPMGGSATRSGAELRQTSGKGFHIGW